MATFNSISTPSFTTTWNGSSFDNTESVLVPADADYVVIFARLGDTALPGTVEFDGVAMTTILASDTNSASAQIYYIAAPVAGTYDFLVDTTTTAIDFQCIIGTVSGTSGIGDTDTVGGFAGDRSLTLTTVANDLVMDVLSSWQAMTVGAGQTTTLLNVNNTSGSQETATTTSTTMSWTHAADWSAQAAIVFTDGGGPSPTIDSSDSSVALGGTVNYTVSGFGSTINDTDINDGTLEVEATTENDTQATFPTLSQALVTPSITTGLNLRVSDGTDSAQATIELTAPTGTTVVAKAAQAGTIEEKDWTFGLANAADVNQFVTRDADTFVTHNADGTSTVSAAGTTVVFSRDNTDGSWTRIEITYDEQGGVVSTNITKAVVSDIVNDIVQTVL